MQDEPALTDHQVVDRHHHHVGKVTDVIFDGQDFRPRWTTVKTGILRGEHLAPMEGAYVSDDGVLVLPFDRETVLHAPKPPRDHVVTPALAEEASAHYSARGRS